MSEFTKTFLKERIGNEKRPRKFFGIFGKHPGWDDHIEDLPLPTASMATAKQLLYVQGIGSQISSGAWARLPDEVRLAGFDHFFLWVRGCQFLAGRMWASQDGKRRDHFPMVALVHGINLPRETMLGAILEQLEGVSAACRSTRSAGDVREVISGISNVESGALPAEESAESGLAVLSKATLPLNQAAVVQAVADFREKIPESCRFPADPQDVVGSLRFWARVCPAVAAGDVPLLFFAPFGEPWVDVLIGEPAPERFFCLRAAPPALPIAGEGTMEDVVGEADADEVIKAIVGTPRPNEERGWISRFLGH